MPVMPTYPGVYVEEISSGVRTVVGVSTSVAAFIDSFKRGPVDKPVQIFSFADFDRVFGGLDAKSEGSYAIQQFFLNGGTEAWVVRVGTAARDKASVQIDDVIPAAAAAMTVSAINEGNWGNQLSVEVNHRGPEATSFDLIVSDLSGQSSTQPEVFRNLTMENCEAVVNDKNTGSNLIRIAIANAASIPPANGTFSGQFSASDVSSGLTLPENPRIQVIVTDTDGDTSNALEVTLRPMRADSAASLSMRVIATALEAAIRAARPADPVFSNATVTFNTSSRRFKFRLGSGSPYNRITFNAVGSGTSEDSTATTLLLTGGIGVTSPVANLHAYRLGEPSGSVDLANTAQWRGTNGNDGLLADAPSAEIATALIGTEANKTGIHALADVALFNLLCIPQTALVSSGTSINGRLQPNSAQTVLSVAIQYCQKRRAFFLMDTPVGFEEPQEIRDWMSDNDTLRDRNAALFYPRVKIPDPLNEFRLRSVGASGTLAGLFARIDSTRGVWKAPAGTEAALANVSAYDYTLTDAENGSLNPLAIDCLRNFPIYGNVCWGARTLEGSDAAASEYKYIPVRRLALFIEESLDRGLKWVVFEPNDEPLWAQIRLNVGAFMNNLFRQGAFQGVTPREAYLVKCDRETTTQNDINLGIVNIVVGFAPLKPAEFVIIKIQQLAGQIAT